MSWTNIIVISLLLTALFVALVSLAAVIVGAKAEKRQRKVMDKKRD